MTNARSINLICGLGPAFILISFEAVVAQTAAVHPLLNPNTGALAYRGRLTSQIYKDSGRNEDAQGGVPAFITDFERTLRAPRSQAAYSTSSRPDPHSPHANVRAIPINLFRVHAAVAPATLDAEGAAAPDTKVAAYVCAHQWNEADKMQQIIGTYQITYSGKIKPDAWEGPHAATKAVCNPYLRARTDQYNQLPAQSTPARPTDTAGTAGESVDGPLLLAPRPRTSGAERQ